jgi:cation/acetate symporter
VTGIPLPQLTYGQVLQKVNILEEKIFEDPAEVDARRLFRERADGYHERILTLPASLEEERRQLSVQIDELKSSNAQMRDVVASSGNVGSCRRAAKMPAATGMA